MQSLFERRVLFYEFALQSKPPLIKWEFPKIVERITEPYKLGKLACLSGDETACIRIQDMKFDKDNNILSLMVNYTDQTLSNPGLQKIHTKDLRKIKKNADEGIPNSIHIVISTAPNKYGTYTGAVEYVPGFPKSIYMKLLNIALKKYCTDVVLDDEANKGKKCWPTIESAILESDELKAALETGTLGGVELIRYDRSEIDFDETDEIMVSKQQLSLKPKSETIGAAARKFIKNCAELGNKKKYSEIRISFKNADGDPASVKAPTSNINAGELCFGKKKRISLRSPIDLCSEKIHAELTRKMTSLVQEEIKAK